MNDDRKLWLGFNLVSGIGPVRLRALLEAFGDVESAWYASESELRQTGLPAKTVRRFLTTRAELDLDREVRRLAQAGFRFLTWEDEEYPGRLLEIYAPPPVLYVWGRIREEDQVAIAVVGTPRPSPYGVSVARDIAIALAEGGATLISGLARGIDSIVHRAILDAGGRTVAVLGSGLDRVYPPEHRRLAARISRSGAVLSDYPLGTRPEAGNFPPRNRIISGMCLAVVVVEAGEESGALITAEFADEQGREVLVVPGSIQSRASRGTNRLIQVGATPIVYPEQVLELLELNAAVRSPMEARPFPGNDLEKSVLDLVSTQPTHVDEVTRRSGLPETEVASILALLELQGWVEQVGGMRYIRPDYRPARKKRNT